MQILGEYSDEYFHRIIDPKLVPAADKSFMLPWAPSEDQAWSTEYVDQFLGLGARDVSLDTNFDSIALLTQTSCVEQFQTIPHKYPHDRFRLYDRFTRSG